MVGRRLRTIHPALLDSLWMAVIVPLLIGLLNWLVIAREEKLLSEIFGESYSAHAARVPRWI